MAVDGHHNNANGGLSVLPLDLHDSPIHPPTSEPGLDHDDDAGGEDLSESERLLFEQTLNADGQPKRPMNAFMLFARKRRPQVASQNHTLRTGEISKILSKEWGSMSPTDKRHFQELARRHKDEFTTKYPDYIYKRRPNNTRRKRSRSDHRVSADAPSSSSHPQLAGPSTAPAALESAPYATAHHHDAVNDDFTEEKPSPATLAMGFHTGGMAGPSQLHLPAHQQSHQHQHQQQHQQASHHQLQSYGYHPPATTAASHVPSGTQHSPLSSTSRHVPHLYPAAPASGPASAISTTYTSTAPSPVSAHGPFSHNPHLHHHPQHQQPQRQHSSLHQNAQYSPHPRESAAHVGSPAHHALAGQVWGEFHSYGRASSSTPHPQPHAPVPTEPSSDPSYHNSSYGNLHQHTRQMSQNDVSRLPRVSTSALTSPSDASGGYFATGVGPSHSPTALTSHVNHRLLASSILAPGVYPTGPADQSGTSSEHSSATHSPVNTPWIRPSDQPTRPFAHSSGSSNPQSVSQTPSPLVPGPGSSYHLPSQEATTHHHPARIDQSLDVHLPSLHQAVPPRTFGVPSQSTQHGPQLVQMMPSNMVTPMQQQQQQQQQQHNSQPQQQPTQQQQAHHALDYHHLGLAPSAGSLSSTNQQSALSAPYIFDDSWQSRQQHPAAHGRYPRDPQQPPPGSSNGY